MKIYLAGPMAGYKDFNFPLFHRAADKLRAQGHTVFSPAEDDEAQYGGDANKSSTGDPQDANRQGFNIRKSYFNDLKNICLEAEAVAFLPGWEESSGAGGEHGVVRALNKYLTDDNKLKYIYLTEEWINEV